MGNNNNNLSGCKNDAILYYNFILNLVNNNSLKEKWLKPDLLLDKDVAVDNITDPIPNRYFIYIYIYV